MEENPSSENIVTARTFWRRFIRSNPRYHRFCHARRYLHPSYMHVEDAEKIDRPPQWEPFVG
ncbi:MAG TPA: hypothetical protein PLX49_11490 [Prolixibacteraceae bacterium]|nr:hypothetical protein [Prolixibacteraceae bacterium]